MLRAHSGLLFFLAGTRQKASSLLFFSVIMLLWVDYFAFESKEKIWTDWNLIGYECCFPRTNKYFFFEPSNLSQINLQSHTMNGAFRTSHHQLINRSSRSWCTRWVEFNLKMSHQISLSVSVPTFLRAPSRRGLNGGNFAGSFSNQFSLCVPPRVPFSTSYHLFAKILVQMFCHP